MRKFLILSASCFCFSGLAHADEIVLPMQMDLPEGYPYLIGSQTVTLDDKTLAYSTYDFSIGAFDSSVQFRHDLDCSGKGACDDTGKIALFVTSFPKGNPNAENEIITIKAVFAKLPISPKKTRDVTVEIQGVNGKDGQFLRQKGAAKLTLTAIKRGLDGSDSYGHLRATVSATLCEANEDALIKGGACHKFTAEFDTDVQYDSI